MKIKLTAFNNLLSGYSHIFSQGVPRHTITFAMDHSTPDFMAIKSNKINSLQKTDFELTQEREFDPKTGRPILIYRMVRVL